MRKILCLAAAIICLASCMDKQGLLVNPPSQLVSYQWYSEETSEEGVDYICVWDFTAQENSICFVWFDSYADMTTFSQYTFRTKNALSYVCHKRGNTWILTVDDGYDTSYYFSDIKNGTVHVSTIDGYENDLKVCPVKITPVKYD